MTSLPFIERCINIRRWFKDYKSKCVCVHCGASQNIEFHHCKGHKTMKIAAMVRKAVSIEELKREIDKCIPLCSKCHKVETARLKHDRSNQEVYRVIR